MRQDAIANAMCDDGECNFWKEIKKLTPNNVPLPTSIDNATGNKEVTELWKTHFEQLLNCVTGRDLNDLNFDCKFNSDLLVKPGEIEDAINSLSEGKSCGLDGIYAEHLKYSSQNYRLLLARCMTSLLVHGILPDKLMSVVLVPIIKDKSGMINSKDNYRPIAIASTMSKLFHSAAIPLKKMNKNGAVRYLFRLLDYRLLIHNKHLKL